MRNHYTKELLEPIIKKSKSWGEVCRTLKVNACTGSQSHIKMRSINFGIDFSHFTGQGWRKGQTFKPKYPIEDFLTNKRRINSDRLKKLLFKNGLKDKRCETCNLTKWLGQEPVFELDHLNNNHNDNRLENLKINCPNCHSLKTRQARMAKKQTR